MTDTADAVERAIARLDPIIHNDHWTTPGEHGEGGIKAALRLELTAAYERGRASMPCYGPGKGLLRDFVQGDGSPQVTPCPCPSCKSRAESQQPREEER